MDSEINELREKFEQISKKGYIKGITNNLSAIGTTFENELNIKANSKSKPDYKGIEIKTRRTYSKSAITLFTAVPDGEKLHEIERIQKQYGYPYKKDRRYKVLYVDVYGDRLTFCGVKFQYKLNVDSEQEKVFLCIYDKYGNLIERKVYWSFKYLENKIMNKLKVLAVVNAWTNKKNNWNFFKYYKIDFYILKSFKKFLELLNMGIIRITLKVDIYKDKENYGKTYDHGCGFKIQENDLTKLYDKYYIKNKYNK